MSDAFAVNTETFAPWMYESYGYNSFAVVDGRVFAATGDTVVELNGDTDDGEPIQARIRTGLIDLNDPGVKNVPRAYLTYSSDGEMEMDAIAVRDGRKSKSSCRMPAHDSEAPSTQSAAFKREAFSNYWQFEIRNVDGADFQLHQTEVYSKPGNLGRRPK
jgi:hypothetical protein